MSADFRINLGYRYAELNAGPRFGVSHIHTADVGFGYSQQFGAQTDFAVSAGAALTPFRQRRRELRVIGQASLRRRFNRSWQAGVAYDRGVHYLEIFPQPLSYDRVEANFSGRLAEKLRVDGSASYSRGHVYLVPSGHPYNLFSGDVRLSWAVSPNATLFADYQLYGYNFQNVALLPVGVPGLLKRNAIQIGVDIIASAPRPR